MLACSYQRCRVSVASSRRTCGCRELNDSKSLAPMRSLSSVMVRVSLSVHLKLCYSVQCSASAPQSLIFSQVFCQCSSVVSPQSSVLPVLFSRFSSVKCSASAPQSFLLSQLFCQCSSVVSSQSSVRPKCFSNCHSIAPHRAAVPETSVTVCHSFALHRAVVPETDGRPPIGVHLRMFIPVLEMQCSPSQKDKWLQRAKRYDILGTYAQTELGHGTV